MKRKANYLSIRKIRIGYFCVCLVVVFLLAGIRSAPVYGKLSFLLLDSKPWWPEWRPMITDVIEKGTQPVLTDPITSAVLNGVFGQRTVFLRRFHHPPFLNIERLEWLNRPSVRVIPLSALLLLLEDDRESNESVRQLLTDLATGKAVRDDGTPGAALLKVYPFRCVINVHGFTPTWVPLETGHWQADLARTGMFYRYNGRRSSQLISRLRENPPENCDVFF